MKSKVEVAALLVTMKMVAQMSKTKKVKVKGYFLSFNRFSTEIAILDDNITKNKRQKDLIKKNELACRSRILFALEQCVE